jgi:hypothetical protein
MPLVTLASAAPPWATPFEATGAAIQKAARGIDTPEGARAQVLLREGRYRLDAEGRLTACDRDVVRILTPQAAEGWGDVSTSWSPWYA